MSRVSTEISGAAERSLRTTAHQGKARYLVLSARRSVTGAADTHSIRLIMAGFLKNLQGSTGSVTLRLSVRYRSQIKRQIHKTPDTVSSAITYADFHGNSDPASSKPAVKANVASRSRIAPIKSTLLSKRGLKTSANLRRGISGFP
jgi:hypothetical protein